MTFVEELVRLFEGCECYAGDYGIVCLGDARELIKRVPDGFVDVVLTDPPWGVEFDSNDDPDVFFELEPEMFRVLKEDSWLVFYYSVKNLPHISRLKLFKYKWMIPYIFMSFGSVGRNALGGQAMYSIVLVMEKGKPKTKQSRKDVIFSTELPVIDGRIRERQFKPTLVTFELLSIFTNLGDVVLDPFGGYGSIPFVCELFGRYWIAFEIERERYETIKELIKNKVIVNLGKPKKKVSGGSKS